MRNFDRSRQAVLALAAKTLKALEEHDVEGEPRDDSGKWTAGGGSSGDESDKPSLPKEHQDFVDSGNDAADEGTLEYAAKAGVISEDEAKRVSAIVEAKDNFDRDSAGSYTAEHGFPATISTAEYYNETKESIQAEMTWRSEMIKEREQEILSGKNRWGEDISPDQINERKKTVESLKSQNERLEKTLKDEDHFTKPMYSQAEVDEDKESSFDKDDPATWNLPKDEVEKFEAIQTDIADVDKKDPETWSAAGDHDIAKAGEQWDELNAAVSDFDESDADTYPEDNQETARTLIEQWETAEAGSPEEAQAAKKMSAYGDIVQKKLEKRLAEHETQSAAMVKSRLDAMKAEYKEKAKAADADLTSRVRANKAKAIAAQKRLEAEFDAIQSKIEKAHAELSEKDNGERDA